MNKIDLAAYLLETDYLNESKKSDRKALVKAELEKRATEKSTELPVPTKTDIIGSSKTSEEKIAEAKARKAKFDAQKKADIEAGIRTGNSTSNVTKAATRAEAIAIDAKNVKAPSAEDVKKLETIKAQEEKIRASKSGEDAKAVRPSNFDTKKRVGQTNRVEKTEPDVRLSSNIILGVICHVLRKDGMYIGKTAKETEYDPATVDKVSKLLGRVSMLAGQHSENPEEYAEKLVSQLVTPKDLEMRDLLFDKIQISAKLREDIKKISKQMVPGGSFNMDSIPSIVHTIGSFVTDQHMAAYQKWKTANEKHKIEEREKGVEDPKDLPKPSVWLDTHFEMWEDRQKKNKENIHTEKFREASDKAMEAGLKKVNKAIDTIKKNIEPDYLGTPGTTVSFIIEKIKNVFRVETKSIPKKQVEEKLGDMMDSLMKAFATMNLEPETSEVSESFDVSDEMIVEDSIRTGLSFKEKIELMLSEADETKKKSERATDVLSSKLERRLSNLGLSKAGINAKDLSTAKKEKRFDDKELRKVRGDIEDIKAELEDIDPSKTDEIKALKDTLGALIAKETDLTTSSKIDDEDDSTPGKDKALYMVLQVNGLTRKNSHLVPFTLYLSYSQFNSDAVNAVFSEFPSFTDLLKAKRKTVAKNTYTAKEDNKVTAVIGATKRVAKFTSIGISIDDDENEVATTEESKKRLGLLKNVDAKKEELERLNLELQKLEDLPTVEHRSKALGILDRIKYIKKELRSVKADDRQEAEKYTGSKSNSSVAGLETYAKKDVEYDDDLKYVMIDWSREQYNTLEVLDATINTDRYRGLTDLYIQAPDKLNVDLSKKIGKEDVSAGKAVDNIKVKAISTLKAKDDGKSSPYIGERKETVDFTISKMDVVRKAEFDKEKKVNIIGHDTMGRAFSTNIPLKVGEGEINPILYKIFDNFPKDESGYDAIEHLDALAKKNFKVRATVVGHDIKSKTAKYPVRLTKAVEKLDDDGKPIMDEHGKPVKEYVPNTNGTYKMGGQLGDQKIDDIIKILKNEKEVLDKFTGITRVQLQ